MILDQNALQLYMVACGVLQFAGHIEIIREKRVTGVHGYYASEIVDLTLLKLYVVIYRDVA